MLLLLKLTLVPAVLLVVSAVGQRFGPRVAGLLAGFPVVTGPILILLSVEFGGAFAASSAAAATSGAASAAVFCLSYALAAVRFPWHLASAIGMGGWLMSAAVLGAMPSSLLLAMVSAMAAIAVAPRLFPRVVAPAASRTIPAVDLLVRVVAGAALTLLVSACAKVAGPRASGLLAVFPLLSLVLAASSHRTQGAAFTVVLLKSLVSGLHAFVAFCAVFALALSAMEIWQAIVIAVLAAVGVQALARWRLAGASS